MVVELKDFSVGQHAVSKTAIEEVVVSSQDLVDCGDLSQSTFKSVPVRFQHLVAHVVL